MDEESGESSKLILNGNRGEFYPCKPDIFETTYELIKEDNE